MAKTFIGIRMERDLADELHAVAALTGSTQTDLVAKALRPHLAKIIRQRHLTELVAAAVKARQRA